MLLQRIESKDRLKEVAPDIVQILDQLVPELDTEAWVGLEGLWNYSDQGRRYVRDFGFQASSALIHGQWRNPSGVAKRHVHEKWTWLRNDSYSSYG